MHNNFIIKYELDYFEDVETALQWYDKIRPSLSDNLMTELKMAISKVQTNPFANSVIFGKDTRRVLVHTFHIKFYTELNQTQSSFLHSFTHHVQANSSKPNQNN